MKFLAWLNKRNLVGIRAVVLYLTLWLTWTAFEWAGRFAFAVLAHGQPGWDVGAIIAAVTLPVTGLQGYVFKVYADSKELDGL